MKALFILNDAPYGSERTYNGTHRGTLDELARWSAEADQVMVF